MTFFLLKFFLWIAKSLGGKNTTTVFFPFVYPLHSFARETWHLFTWQRTVRNTKKTVVADGGLWGWAERAEETTSTSIAGEYCIWGRRRKVILEREKDFPWSTNTIESDTLEERMSGEESGNIRCGARRCNEIIACGGARAAGPIRDRYAPALSSVLLVVR